MTGKTNITEHSEVVQRIKTHAHLMITTNINNNGSLATYTTTRENSMDSDKNVRLSIAKIIRKIYKGTEKDQSQVGHSSSSRSLLASAVMKITHSKKVNRQQHMVHQIDEDVVEPSLLPSTFQESGSSCVSSTIVIPIAQPPIHPVSSESESTVSLIDEDQIEFIPSTFSSPASSFTSHSSDHNDLSVHLLEEESVEQKIECSIPRFYFPNSNNCVFNQSPSSDSFVSRFPEMTSFFSRYPSDEGVPLMLFMTVCKEWFNFPSFCALPLAKRIHKVYGHYGNHRVANFGNKGLKNKKSLPGSTQVSMSTSRSFIERRSSLVGTSKDSSSSSSDSDRHIDGLLQDKDSATSSPFNLSSDTDDDGENFKSVVIEVQEEHNGVTKVSRRYKQLPLEQHKYDLATISNDSFEMDEHPQKKPSENELDLLDGTGVHVRFAPFAKYWKKEIEPCDATERMFNLIKQPNNDVIYPNDLYPFVFQLVQLHPGLAVLRGGNSGSNATSVTVFQHDYIVTSIVRYFYTVNRSRTGKINRGEFRRGNLLTVWKFLDNEDDIEQELHYFSYEEFYYLYCSFQDLDTDQDGVLTENDLKRYAGGVLTQEVIDRYVVYFLRLKCNNFILMQGILCW